MLGFFSKPEPIVLKEGWESKEYLEKLKSLEPNERIQQEIAMMERQVLIEQGALLALQKSDQDYAILKDLNFEVNGKKQHLDFYVITPKLSFIMECKTWGNPMERAEEALFTLKERRMKTVSKIQQASLESMFHDFFKVLVVTDDLEECRASWNQNREPICQVTTPRRLRSTIEEMNRGSKAHKLSQKKIRQTGENLMRSLDGEPFFYEERYQELLSGIETV